MLDSIPNVAVPSAQIFAERVAFLSQWNPKGFRTARRDGRGFNTLMEKAAIAAGMIGDDYKVERSDRGKRKAKRKSLYLHKLRLERIARDAWREYTDNPVAAYPANR